MLLAITAVAPSDGLTSSTGPLVAVSGASPFRACTADAPAGQTGINFPDSEVEVFLTVNPANPDQMAALWQQDRWSNGGARGLVSGASRDGGRTWTTTVLPGVSLCSGGTFQRATDPWVSFGPTGELYAISLSLNNSDEGHGLLVSKSDDGGLTWGTPITILSENVPGVLNDKQSITADPTDARFAYAVWDRLSSGTGTTPFTGPTYFSRTTDGGRTWEPARSILETGPANQSLGNQIAVTPDGTLVNLFSSINNTPGRRVEIAAIRSTDKGATWSAPIRVDSQAAIGTSDPDTRAPVRAGGFIPDIAVDRRSGTIYAVWEEGRFEANQAGSVAMSQSTDGGLTWSPAVKVNQTPSSVPVRNRQAFLPQIDVMGDATAVVSYYDFRNNDAGPDLRTDVFTAHCHGGCASAAAWGDETRITDTSFDLSRAPNARGFFVGDYTGLDHAGNDALVLFTQTQDSDPSSVFVRRVTSGRSAPATLPVPPPEPTRTARGYRLVGTDGGVFAFGDAGFFGSTGSTALLRPIVGSAATPSGNGYWLVAADGGVFAFGDAVFRGSSGGLALRSPVVGMAATPSGNGYWLVAADGGVFAFGDARFLGSTGALALRRPIVAMTATPSGNGYWLVASDGGVFAFGDARFAGSTGAVPLRSPVVGMAATPSGNGYWLVAADGGVFAFGDARFAGSTGALALRRPVVGMATTPTGGGYLLVASDGGVFAFGDAVFRGSTGALALRSPVVGLTG